MLVLKLVWHIKKKKAGEGTYKLHPSHNILGRGMSIYRQGRHTQND